MAEVNLFDKIGVYTYSAGGKYDGMLNDDKKCGQGIIVYHNQEYFTILMVKNMKVIGKLKKCREMVFTSRILGVYYYKCGDKYTGEWRDNKRNGHGNLYPKLQEFMIMLMDTDMMVNGLMI